MLFLFDFCWCMIESGNRKHKPSYLYRCAVCKGVSLKPKRYMFGFHCTQQMHHFPSDNNRFGFTSIVFDWKSWKPKSTRFLFISRVKKKCSKFLNSLIRRKFNRPKTKTIWNLVFNHSLVGVIDVSSLKSFDYYGSWLLRWPIQNRLEPLFV